MDIHNWFPQPLEPNLPRSEEEFTWPSEVVNQVEREMQDELFSPLSVIQEGEKERINFAAIAKSFTPPGRSLEDKLLKMEWDEDDGTFYPAIEETEVNIGGRIVRLMDLAMKNAWNGNPSFTNMEENITLPEPTPVWMFAADCNYCCSMRYIPTKVQPNQYWLSILLDEEED